MNVGVVGSAIYCPLKKIDQDFGLLIFLTLNLSEHYDKRFRGTCLCRVDRRHSVRRAATPAKWIIDYRTSVMRDSRVSVPLRSMKITKVEPGVPIIQIAKMNSPVTRMKYCRFVSSYYFPTNDFQNNKSIVCFKSRAVDTCHWQTIVASATPRCRWKKVIWWNYWK